MTLPAVLLPDGRGGLTRYEPSGAAPLDPPTAPLTSRRAYAAAHVVSQPLADTTAAVDWDRTLAYRRHLWRHGLGVADAMDTAQRGMGLDWTTSAELIRRVGAEAAAEGGALVCGAATDQLPVGPAGTDAIVRAYGEQCALIEGAGATPVLMASRQLAATAGGADEYRKVYERVLAQVSRPVILHWLGTAFDPALAGYWGFDTVDRATETVLEIIAARPDRIDGIKVSLLDADHEVRLRRRLPVGVRLYTGDDFNYPELIAADEEGRHSDALLGIFDAIAPVAAAALAALDAGEGERFHALLGPTVPLARHIFATPTYHYKTGLVFLAYLNGHQGHFRMVAGLESARSIPHLCRLFVLADRARLLADPEFAVRRLRAVLRVAGLWE